MINEILLSYFNILLYKFLIPTYYITVEESLCLNDGKKDCLLISNRTIKVLPEEKVVRTNLLVNNIHYKRYNKNNFVSKLFPDVDYYIDAGRGKYLFDNYKIEYEKTGILKKTILKQEFRYSNLKMF